MEFALDWSTSGFANDEDNASDYIGKASTEIIVIPVSMDWTASMAIKATICAPRLREHLLRMPYDLVILLIQLTSSVVT